MLIISISAAAQHPLSQGRRTSEYDYLYQLTDNEAIKITGKGQQQIIAACLHTLKDSVLHGSPLPENLLPGNYLRVCAKDDHLEAAFVPINNIAVKFGLNWRDLMVILHDQQGALIRDAEVRIGKNKLPYDAQTQTWRKEKYNKQELLQIYYKGVLNCIPLSRVINRYAKRRRPNIIQRLKYNNPRVRSDYYNTQNNRYRYGSYIAFNKPAYKPGDTVKFKGFLSNKKGFAYNKKVLVRLVDKDFDVDTILTAIMPATPGNYHYQFVLSPALIEQLDLTLDRTYRISFETPESRKYDLNNYDGDLTDEEYAAKRTILLQGSFKLEEYELQQLTFSARADKSTHKAGDPLSVYLSAKDENDLPVMDGKICLYVELKSIGKMYENIVVPDTLWQYSGGLDILGETRIMLPDSIFPKADLTYRITCVFTNSNNERKTNILTATYAYNNSGFNFRTSHDTLHITRLIPASGTENVLIAALNQRNDTIGKYYRPLPAAIKLSPFSDHYAVISRNTVEHYVVDANLPDISLLSNWHDDIAGIQVQNPLQLPLWYTIISGKKIVERGYSDSLHWQGSTKHNKQYYVYVNYIWKNKIMQKGEALQDPGGRLHVAVTTPRTVYPGQTTDINIHVTDKYQRPVAGADLTAFGYTSKFWGNTDIAISAFGLQTKKRKLYPMVDSSSHALHPSAFLTLDWLTYRKKMGLDTLPFFRFTHPDSVFTFTEPTPDSVTQIAPYVFSEGHMQAAEILEIDGMPVYYTRSFPSRPYSFAVTPGKHSIGIRTLYQSIRFDMVAQKGVKTFISINSAIQLPGYAVERVPYSLTTYEMATLDRYMLRLENTFTPDDQVYIRQQSQFYEVNNIIAAPEYRWRDLLIGPMTKADALLIKKNSFIQSFTPEPGYLFDIREGFVKEKEQKEDLADIYENVTRDTSLSSLALTGKLVDSMIRKHQDEMLLTISKQFTRAYKDRSDSRVQISFGQQEQKLSNSIQQFLFFRYDSSSTVRAFGPDKRQFTDMHPGYYKMIILLNDNRYLLQDSLFLRSGVLHGYLFDTLPILAADNSSKRLDTLLRKALTIPGVKQSVIETYIRQFNTAKSKDTTSVWITGIVQDEHFYPVQWASVKIAGSKTGIATDENGRFSIRVMKEETLDISFVGYEMVSIPVTDATDYVITMHQSSNRMQEVVVTALGIKREQKALGYAVSTITSEQITNIHYRNFAEALQGKAAGVHITIAPSSHEIILETQGEEALPDMNELPQGIPAYSLRSNFRDDAFWQPALLTDANGNASFKVTYPDDITKWQTTVIAMSGKKQAGINQMAIRSFKTLTGTLAIPTFTVNGDSVLVIGKALNYASDSMNINRSFFVNNNLLKHANGYLTNAIIDTVPVVINTTDSIQFRYTVEKEGYMDGEERKIPVIERGTTETKDLFTALRNDTSFTYTPAYHSPLVVHAVSAVLPILTDEIEQVENYKYLCNEQLASKLKAFLLEKKIAASLHKDFGKNKDIKRIIDKLNQQKNQGMWGWWRESPASLWITRHVTEAMIMAETQGYKTDLNKESIINLLTRELTATRCNDSIGYMLLLSQLNASIDYKSNIDSLIARSGKNGYDTIRLTLLQQQTGLPVDLSTLLSRQQQTVFGNTFWGKDTVHLFNNSIQSTLQMYKILRHAGGHDALLQSIRAYFLEQRQTGHWRNTYESAQILETILPDVMQEEAQSAATVDINGKKITQFPYTDTVTAGDITIRKQGKTPVYFTAYQQFFNKAPEKIAGLFDVTSVFADANTTLATLEAGKPVTLTVTVYAKQTADYVLVEIPIPAGCSYADKSGQWSNNEVHREHFKEKVGIFCTQLTAGKHTFTVSLLPRYTGKYYLNPAKAEMQYFPVFMGREALKQVYIH
ncbi:putative large extracellular alpha-helical protein [Chitinophaga pinensis DSM 2588]|uniref:Large extracellular alpha-helical protein n=1 Tax=Chitinophaga pinensis (strain ATCC 43595 / DSM 2588 / LMG 13176 / NBRC 15968 / NCIMB 11800 / UQM 2034) TaxID=485918 RepID=A0A979G7S5_CHIPD|nr:putative large extracellular alpha-helical protein [Chitinophaga pinensis DSM 2588]